MKRSGASVCFDIKEICITIRWPYQSIFIFI